MPAPPSPNLQLLVKEEANSARFLFLSTQEMSALHCVSTELNLPSLLPSFLLPSTPTFKASFTEDKQHIC